METAQRDPALFPNSQDDIENNNDIEKDQGSGPSIPHYALPNFSAILPDYSNTEQDIIRQAYSCANYTPLKQIPNDIKTANILRARAEHIDSNLRMGPADPSVVSMGRSCIKATTKNGMFQEFEYVPSRYTLADELKSKEREENLAKQVVDRNGKVNPFIPSGQPPTEKYKDPFLPLEAQKTYRYPTTALDDPFEAARDEQVRQKWIEDSKILSGPFRPPGSNNRGDKPTRLLVPEILSTLEKMLEEDWADCRFDVQVNEQEDIVIRFDLKSLDSVPGLMAYMNIMARCNEVVNTYSLKKVVEDWGRQVDDVLIYFTFRPPWRATRTSLTYYNLHPEEKLTVSQQNNPQASKSSNGDA